MYFTREQSMLGKIPFHPGLNQGINDDWVNVLKIATSYYLADMYTKLLTIGKFKETLNLPRRIVSLIKLKDMKLRGFLRKIWSWRVFWGRYEVFLEDLKLSRSYSWVLKKWGSLEQVADKEQGGELKDYVLNQLLYGGWE